MSRKIRKKHRWISVFLILGAFLCHGSVAYAEPMENISVSVPVEQRVELEGSGTVPDAWGEPSVYVMTALEEDSPMPEGSTDREWRFELKGNARKEIGPVRYERVGVYRYRIRQEAGEAREGYQPDLREYNLMVCIKNAEQGGLKYEILVENSEGEKTDGIVFENLYTAKQDDKTYGAQTGDRAAGVLWILLAAASALTIVLVKRCCRTLKN